MNAFGTTGRVEIEIPFNAPPDKPCKIWHQVDEDVKEITFDICDQYTIQGDLFAEAVLDDKPIPTPIGDAVKNMNVIEAIVASSESNAWVDL
jgi:predicted dehydrogenase